MKRPHVVVLMADQLRRDVLGCYGGPHGASENLDRLAGESVLLARHTTNCPLCVPARTSIVTGVHPHVHGAIVNAWDAPERPYGTCRDLPTLYEALAEAGYRVEHVGVNHLRCEPPLDRRSRRIRFFANPAEHGRQLKQRGLAVDLSACRSPCVEYVAGEPVTRYYTNPNTLRWPHAPEEFLDSWLAGRMVERIAAAEASEPLALMGMFWLPHCPLSCPEPYFSMYDPEKIALPATVGRWCEGQSPMHLLNLPGHVAASTTMDGWRRAWATYLGMVRLLDECVGRVLEALRQRGLWDDALVIVTADHGEMLGSHRMFQKMCMYEEAVRVPLLVKPPGRQAAGVRESLTQHLDLAATICDYAGAAMPAGRGRSCRDLIDSPDAPGREEVFAEYNGNSGRSFQQRAVITPTHKYIYNHGYAPELYDLQADPLETQNLCGSDPPPAEAAELRRRLRQWMRRTGDYIRMPEDDGERAQTPAPPY